MTAVELRHVTYAYPDGTAALRDVNLQIPGGERVALLGPNGAGKSTLLLHLNSLLVPQDGTVVVLGKEVVPNKSDWVRETVGLVFQDPDDQVFSSTVGEDVAFGPENMGLPTDSVAERVCNALSQVGLAGFEHRAPHHLSYGEKKRVAIAGILATDAPVLVLDEPMAYLDPQGQRLVREILDDLSRQGRTMIVATHDVDFAAEWATWVVILRDGQVFRQGTTDLLLDHELLEQASLVPPTVAQVFSGFNSLHHNGCPIRIEQARAALQAIEQRLEE